MTLSPMFLTLMLPNHKNTVFDLVYVAWSPFGIETSSQFVISFMMEWLTTLPVYTAFVSKTVFIKLFEREFRYQCDRLKEAMRTICERIPLTRKEIIAVNEKCNDNSIQRIIKCDETAFLKKLAECEEHYRKIQK